MVDVDTFLTTLSVMVDDFCKTSLPPECHPGPQAALSRSEAVTLAVCGQWQPFGSERGFSRYAQRHLRAAFPQLPSRAPALHAFRELLKREKEREDSYKNDDIYSMPIGSRYHPERAPIWETNSPIESTERWMGRR